MRNLAARGLVVASLCSSFGAACGPTAPEPASPASTAPPATTVAASASANAPAALVADLSVPPVTWENPGGMWMPEQVAQQGDTLKKLGFTIDPAAFAKPTEPPLGALVSLGGCSASFVSPDGLIITNHHCVIGALQYNSTPSQNLLRDGFTSKDRADERSNGPASRVFVTTRFTDVTSKVREGLDKKRDDLARYQAIEDRQKQIVADCEKGHDGVRCTVMSYFGGAQFTLVEQLEIRDVRLVFAPPEGIGNYGGETDNWRWPRHAGDFGFYRAYVGKDGKPADYAKDNVPYRPAHYLKIASKPLAPGAPVLVAGYPARTNRLTTAGETKEAVTYELPYVLDFTQAYLDALQAISKSDPSVAIKAETLIRGLANWQTNTKGQLDGLVKDGLAKKKDDAEAALGKFIDGDPARKAKYGKVLAELGALDAERAKFRDADHVAREAFRMVRLFGAAQTIVRNAEERAKPDEKRDPDYQDRNQKRLEQGFVQMTKQYDPKLDQAMFNLVIERERRLPVDERFGLADAVLGKAEPEKRSPPADHRIAVRIADDAKHVDKETVARWNFVAPLYDKTKLGDEATRVSLLRTARIADLQKSDDPFIQLAMALRPKTRAGEEREKRFTGKMATLRPLYVEALREQRGGNLAPDANRTLRVTYGTVRGYAPKPGAPVYYPFTKLSEVVAKNTGTGEFAAPKALLDAFAEKRFGRYVDPKLAEVPVDFLSDLDITGGNSGSATLNADGDLVGLAFDGNYESMASDWLFMPEITRTIHVDIRYVLWVIDAVGKDDALLAELGVRASAH